VGDGLGGRVGRGARLARLSTTMGAGLVRARRDERRGDRAAGADHHEAVADALVETLGGMKAAAMKVGQMLSFVDLDLDPETTAVYQRKLAALVDDAPASDPEAVARVVEGEYGAPAETVFAEWDPQPFAVASIGQVHRARTVEGHEVAVKVQHPGVAEAVAADLRNVAAILPIVRLASRTLDARGVMAEITERIGAELDYQQEAQFQQAFVERYAGHPFVRVPAVHAEYCRPRVLVTDYVRGRTFEQMVATASPEERDRYGEILFRFVFGSLYRFRLFNADPHPGNFLFGDDGTVTFLDFGCSKAFPSATRDALREVHRAVADADPATLQPALVAAGLLAPDPGDDVDLDGVLGWFRVMYEPLAEDAPYTYTVDYARRCAAASMDPSLGYVDALRALQMPADYLLLLRIQWGVNSLLGRVRPTANWQRVMAELADGSAPATALGEQEQDFLGASTFLR